MDLTIDPDDPRVTEALTTLFGDRWRVPYRTRQGENMMRYEMARLITALGRAACQDSPAAPFSSQ